MEILNNITITEFIINLTIQSLAVSVVGCLLVLLFRKRAAIYRSLVSSSVMVALFLVIFFSLAFQLTDITWSKPILSIDNSYINNTTPSPPVMENKANQANHETKPVLTAVNKASQSNEADIVSGTKINGAGIFWINCFGILWLAGFMFIFMKLCYSLIFLRGFKAATRTKLNDEFILVLREVSKAFKFNYLPEVFISNAIESPVTIGVSRVSVFIPESLYGNMSEDEFRSILFHEFAHIHHKDQLFSILDKLIIATNWWNPLVYHISTEQNLAREDVCDNYAIKGIKSAEVYSSCLVNLAEKICLISNLPATAGMAGKYISLEQRIKNILAKDRKMNVKIGTAVKLAGCVLMIAASACFAGTGVKVEKTNIQKQTGTDIQKKLRQTIVPAITYNNVNVEKVVRDFNGYNFSKDIDPEQTGVRFILRLDQEQLKGRKVRVLADSISFEKILQLMCKSANLKYRIENNAVVFYASDKKAETKADIEKILKETVITTITYNNVSIEKVVNDLDGYVFSKDLDPEQTGVRFILNLDKKQLRKRKVSVYAKNLSFEKAIKLICKSANLEYRIENNSVEFFVSDKNTNIKVNQNDKIREILRKTIVPAVTYDKVDIGTVVNDLNVYDFSKSIGSEKTTGVRFILKLNQKRAKRYKVRIRARNVSFEKALTLICKSAHLKYRIKDNAVEIY